MSVNFTHPCSSPKSWARPPPFTNGQSQVIGQREGPEVWKEAGLGQALEKGKRREMGETRRWKGGLCGGEAVSTQAGLGGEGWREG